MNVEIEKKYRISDYKKIKELIISLGGSQVSITNDIDTYFRVPQIKPNTKYLRLRTRCGKSTLAYHEVKNDIETMEWETTIFDGDILIEIIQKLGFSKDVVVDKLRETYKLKNSEILIDFVKGLGYFIEIESKKETELDSIAEKLGLNEQIKGLGYPDLLKETIKK